MPPSFEFAVVAELTHSADQWFTLVRRCERLGYDALFVTDHTYQRLSAVPALAAAAPVSTGLRLGTYVLNNDLRNPAVMAREILTVHTLSGNRAVLGLGAGWMSADYRDTELPLDSGGTRYERLSAAVRTVKQVFAGRTGAGHPAASASAPACPSPPAFLLGGARRRTLTLAGREADIVSILPPLGPNGPNDYADGLPEKVDAQVAWVRAAAAGRSSPPLLNHLLWACVVTSDPPAALEALAKQLGYPPADMARMVPFLVGTIDQMALNLLARRDRWGFSLVTIPEVAMEQFAPVIALLRDE
ncbi:TIGR03621 family F420-dependent LLM class oxidoreductase [Streptomyces sp. MB09-02B]|uniref:TIGR03621 family F420-dependent LLM class oxidoreductase n=1 Tax=Streptomyces sp. MB09-02B TaxID=3028667 RepID=UPI0029BE574D|nr:TIGR03621 family F420-dependent LLM class oxidoreductase [Streptomyces sp. MB09-02B]MDX3639094.1 TIGR03621 family F420-dependent LLM class oxidoreductase [Streptomyces sp. MB09-02B]